MNFKINYDKQPRKFLKSSERKLALRILDKLELLKENPVPSNAKRMQGHQEPIFRIRIGKHRVLYRINYKTNLIIIIKIDKRDRVYD